MSKANNYDVVLEKLGDQPLKTAKVLCGVLGLGLAAAKGIVDKVPATVAKGIDGAKALELKKQLDELGNTVSVPGLKIEDGSSSSGKKTALKKTAAAASDDFDAPLGGTAPKTEKKSKSKKSKAKVVDKQVVVEEYFAELAQIRQEIKATGTYSGDGDMKPEIALAVYGDMDAVFSSFKTETLSGYMRIARSELENQYKKLSKKIEKMKKARRFEKAVKCFSDDDRMVPCINYELALLCLRNNRPGSYLNYLYTAAAGGDPRAITYRQRYYSTNTNNANPYAEAVWAQNVRLNGEFNFYQMLCCAVRGIGFDYSPYYPDSSISIPAWIWGEVNAEKRRAKSLGELLQALSYFVIPENIGTADYKEHFSDFVPGELQIKMARQWFFVEDDRLVMSEETKKLRDELREKIIDAICGTPQKSAETDGQKAPAAAAVSAEVKRVPKGKIERKEFGNGSYEGEMKNGKFHGYGVYRWNNGCTYEGEWENGSFCGYGIYRWADGDMYDGEWKNDKRHGNGKWFNADGSYYTGVWENGTRVSASEMIGSSEKVTGVKRERVTYDNGSYEGEIVDGLRHGKGKYTWSNGSEYEGDWVKGKRCGFGTYKSYSKNEKDGSTYTSYIYEGEWKDSKQHGRGVAKGYKAFPLFGHVYMNWSYDGPWVDDNKHGHGVYWEWDGNAIHEMWKIYEGEWIDGTRQGLFTMKYEPSGTGKTYINYYVDGSAEVWGAPYSPSIKTLEDARRAKQEADGKERREYDAKKAREAGQSGSYGSSSDSEDFVQDCYNKAIKAYNNREYFHSAYYLHRGGLSGDAFYRSVSAMCYHPSGATGYAYVENILTSRSLGNISDDEINICAFVLDKFVPKGTKNSKTYRAWCYYRSGYVKKAAGMISCRGLMFHNGRIQDIMEIMGGQPSSRSTPYSDEIMADLFRCKLWTKLDMENDWVSQLRKNEHLKEKLLLAEAYVKFAKKERWQYALSEIEEDIRTFKAALR